MARLRRRPPRPGALTELPPLKILTQILLLQTIFYISATILILFSALVAGKHFSLDLVLNWKSLRGDTTVGWMLGLVWLMNSLIGYASMLRGRFAPWDAILEGDNGILIWICDRVVSILLLVSRSKLVPDFALTLHFLHLLTVSLYSHSLPQNILWWLLQIASSALMISLGVWSCQYRELRPINFGSSSTTTATTTTTAPVEGEDHGDLEQGYGRGRGRGRGRDGAGEYEMMGMKEGTAGEASSAS